MALLNRPPQLRAKGASRTFRFSLGLPSNSETRTTPFRLHCAWPWRVGVLQRFLLCLTLGLILSTTLIAQVFKEYDLKALFLYNFAQFVDWPPEAFPSRTTPLVIGVLGQDHFGKSLDDLTQSQTASASDRDGSASAARRKFKIERSRRFTDVQNCHILFIDQSESANLDEILRKCRGKPILTVSDIDGFSHRGGMIEFITDEKEKKIRLRINVSAAKDAHLAISSKLLKLAQIE